MKDPATHRPWARVLVSAGLLMLMGGQAYAQVNPVWDHYRFYFVAPSPASTPDVVVEDQFGTWNYGSLELHYFLNPDQKTHNGVVHPINDPRLHYTWWHLGQETINQPVQVENQFGPQVVNLRSNVNYLLNPATKNDPGPIPVANHYKCYECIGQGPNVTVDLQDQFTSRTATVMEPAWMCVPAKKTVVATGQTFDIVDPDQHYVCYVIGREQVTNTATVTDQFVQNWDLNFSMNELLCVPSTKFEATPTEPRTWGRVKILYR